MTPEALDQCPFCGGTPQISSAGFGYHTIHCEACRVVQPGKPRDEAIAAWNRRLVCEDVRPEVVEIYPDCQDPGCESCNAARSSKPETAEVVEALEPFAKAFEDLRYTVSGHGKRWDLAPEDEDDCGPTVYCKTERVDGASCGTSTDLELADFVRAAKLLAALKGSRP